MLPFCLSTDSSALTAIMDGYKSDLFCKKLAKVDIPRARSVNGFWYIGNRLLIPRVGDVREQIHWGISGLTNYFYWPNMWRDLEKAYIPSCTDLQRNKSPATSPPGPPHPLPVPDERGQSVAVDFIGPLKEDVGFHSILSITDH